MDCENPKQPNRPKTFEFIQINLDLVTLVYDAYDELIPIITEDKLTEFVTKNELTDPKRCSRLFKVIRSDYNLHPGLHSEFIYDGLGPTQLAIRENKLVKLNKDIREGKIFIDRLGSGSIDLLNLIETKIGLGPRVITLEQEQE